MTNTKIRDKHDFAYCVGLVRTLETLLLNENEVERMMLASSPEEAFKILNEFDYSNNKTAAETPADFQKVITEGLIEIKETLERNTPSKNVLNIVLLGYDFHNMKTMLKAKLSGKSYEEVESLINEMGAIPTESLRKIIFDGEDAPFFLAEVTEKYLKKKIQRVQELFKKDNDPQIIDLYLDQKLMKTIFGAAQDSGSEFLVKYVQLLFQIRRKLF